MAWSTGIRCGVGADVSSVAIGARNLLRGRQGHPQALPCVRRWLVLRPSHTAGAGRDTRVSSDQRVSPRGRAHRVRYARAPVACSPSRSRAARLVSRRMARTLRTARAQAFGCPISTTSCLPRVTPVYSRLRASMG